MSATVTLVCSVCGSTALRFDTPWGHPAAIDERFPVAMCLNHANAKWQPVISETAFRKRPRRKSAEPIDLFATLPDNEQAALRRPIR